MMAFTFDDGPVGTADTATSIRIQNALAASKQNATFFYWGSRINASTETEIKRAFDMGFEIGNHSFAHKNMQLLSAEEAEEEIKKGM